MLFRSRSVRDGRLQSRGPSNFHLAVETQHSQNEFNVATHECTGQSRGGRVHPPSSPSKGSALEHGQPKLVISSALLLFTRTHRKEALDVFKGHKGGDGSGEGPQSVYSHL